MCSHAPRSHAMHSCSAGVFLYQTVSLASLPGFPRYAVLLASVRAGQQPVAYDPARAPNRAKLKLHPVLYLYVAGRMCSHAPRSHAMHSCSAGVFLYQTVSLAPVPRYAVLLASVRAGHRVSCPRTARTINARN